MFLRALRVENYRAVRKATLNFDATTALTGENHSGMSSLLDALEQVLDGDSGAPAFDAFHFHHEKQGDPASGPIRIQLTFTERQPGDWSAEAYAPLAALLPPATQVREVRLEVFAAADADTGPAAKWRLRVPATGKTVTDPQLLHWVQRMNPVVRLSAGMLTGHGTNHLPAKTAGPPAAALSAEMATLVARIESAAGALLSGRSMDKAADLERGFTAARELMARSSQHLELGEFGLTRSVGEILGWGRDDQGPTAASVRHESGSTPERLGVLLLVAALLRASPGGLAPGVDPVWIIEDPEAHLHPMTLASVALLLGRIRWQKIITTHSGHLLAAIPLRHIRRLTRHNGMLTEHQVHEHELSRDDLRRVNYHLRTRHGAASFSRLWLLVEGESEFWIIPQIARLLGYEFALEGISCIEFAQCGVEPLIKVADGLGIDWHLLADGDDAGQRYLESARRHLRGRDEDERITRLRQRDIERCFWHHGYADIYRHHARLSQSSGKHLPPGKVIERAVKRRSKPYLALSIVEAAAAEDSAGIPGVLKTMIEVCVAAARAAPQRLAESANSKSRRH